jgi:hypothetical protein
MTASYIPTTEEIREYIEVGGEPRPWIELNAEEEAKEAARAAAFDRWLAAEVRESKAEAWDEGARAENDYFGRCEDAESAGQGVMIYRQKNPYRNGDA